MTNSKLQSHKNYKNLKPLIFYQNMLKPFHKKKQNTGIKKNGKINAQEQLK